MDLNSYIGLKVKILLINGYYYVGKVVGSEEDSLELRDIKGQLVFLKKDLISSIQEVKKWKLND